jgi:hypothetical protein|tara:strand:- start:27087 stop:27569 length:483 start_codon:yes stop_codon:yes gene_type:complete
MDPITIGAALVGAKKLIEMSSDIKDVASALDNIFSLTKKAEKAKKAADAGDSSYKSVIADVVTERNNQTLLRNLSIDVDDKFGFGTWSAIEKEHERRIAVEEENKVKAAKKLKAKKKADKEFWDRVLYWLGEFGKLILVLGLSGGAGYIIWINRCVSGNC